MTQKMRKTTLNDGGFDLNNTSKKNDLKDDGIGSLLKDNPFRGNS